MTESLYKNVTHVLFVMFVFAVGTFVFVMSCMVLINALAFGIVLFTNLTRIIDHVYDLPGFAFQLLYVSPLAGAITGLATCAMRGRFKANIDRSEKLLARFGGAVGSGLSGHFYITYVSEPGFDPFPRVIIYMISVYYLTWIVTGWLTDWYVRKFVVLWQPEHLEGG